MRRGVPRCRPEPPLAGRAVWCAWCFHHKCSHATVPSGHGAGAGHWLTPGSAQRVEVLPLRVQACATAHRAGWVLLHLVRSRHGQPCHGARSSRCWPLATGSSQGSALLVEVVPLCRRVPPRTGRAVWCAWCFHHRCSHATVPTGHGTGTGHWLTPGSAQCVAVLSRCRRVPNYPATCQRSEPRT